MSLKFVVVRFVSIDQTDDYHDHTYEFNYVELISVGWPNGARSRQKRFRDFDKANQYANRLLAGGWITESVYRKLWADLAIVEARVLSRAETQNKLHADLLAWKELALSYVKNVEVLDCR